MQQTRRGVLSTYVLTYNPDKWNWDPKDRGAAIRRTAGGKISRGRWSTGRRTRDIASGDTAVLLRQGKGDRGLIGRGTFASSVYQDLHWDGSGRDANYADVDWDVMLADADLISVADVAAAVTTVDWDNIQASGIVVPAPGDKALAGLWPRSAAAAGGGGGPKATGGKGKKQAWQNDPVRRKAVEDHAQKMLEEKYRRDGWTVTDTRFGSPYDAVAKKGKRTLYLEAKGTESDGRSVLVTAGEVRWAEQHPGECVLGVVSGISFDAAGNLEKQSGHLTEYSWSPTSGQLVAKTYVWTPPTP